MQNYSFALQVALFPLNVSMGSMGFGPASLHWFSLSQKQRASVCLDLLLSVLVLYSLDSFHKMVCLMVKPADAYMNSICMHQQVLPSRKLGFRREEEKGGTICLIIGGNTDHRSVPVVFAGVCLRKTHALFRSKGHSLVHCYRKWVRGQIVTFL